MQITQFIHEKSLRLGIIGRAGEEKHLPCSVKSCKISVFSKEFPFMPSRREYSREKRRKFLESDATTARALGRIADVVSHRSLPAVALIRKIRRWSEITASATKITEVCEVKDLNILKVMK